MSAHNLSSASCCRTTCQVPSCAHTNLWKQDRTQTRPEEKQRRDEREVRDIKEEVRD